MDISSNKQASLTLSLGSAYYFPYELLLAVSFVTGQYELFLSSISMSYVWEVSSITVHCGQSQVLLGNYLFLGMPFVIV